MRIIDRPSPNFNARRHGGDPDMVVLHGTWMADTDAALARLCDPAAEVSAHYVICDSGATYRLVAEEARAWHAGTGAWGGVRDVNSHSVGIELANSGEAGYPEAQMAALEDLLTGILARWRIPPERVIAHSDMAPERKDDPGRRFDWRRLAAAGLSVWAEPGAPGNFADDAYKFGYRTTPDLALRAFRLRFRAGHAGPLEDTDRGMMAALAARWPCLDAAGTGS